MAASCVTRFEAANILIEQLELPSQGPKETLAGLFPHVFPGEYHGDMDESFPDKPATHEIVLVALVRWIGWDTVRYDRNLEPVVTPFVTPEGFPYYAPDPTPRSIPYVIAAIEHGLITQDDLPQLRTETTAGDVEALCRRIRSLQRDGGALVAPVVLTDDHARNPDLGSRLSSPRQLIVVPENWSNYDCFYNLPNPTLNLGSSSLRLCDTSSPLFNARQDYFPLGPLDTLLTIGKAVPKESYSHQSQALYARVDNASTTVNAVGLWGCAQSQAQNARVWAGFLQCSTAEGEDNDAQAIGLEVDVINNTLPGTHPNRSKTGIQVVGIGNAACTNAIEILGAGQAQWYNGILISDRTIHEEGTVLGVSQPTPVARGIDFSHTPFTDAAMKVSNNSKVSFVSKSGSNAEVYADDIDEGCLVLRSGKSGLRIVNNDNTANLLWILPDGTIHPSSKLVQNYRRMAAAAFGLAAVCTLLLGATWWKIGAMEQTNPPYAERFAHLAPSR